jgi:hypothetical protein
VCKLIFFQKITHQASFSVEITLAPKESRWEENEWLQKKLFDLLSMLKEAWQVYFLQSQIYMEKIHSNKKR